MSELRAKQQRVWSSGDYNRIAGLTVAVDEAVVAFAEVAPVPPAPSSPASSSTGSVWAGPPWC